MNKRNIFLSLALAAVLQGQAVVKLTHKGSDYRLTVNDESMLILGGELSNSAATSVADIDSVMPRMQKLGLNTVFVPAYWELLEPVEGTFDFTLVDEIIHQARQHHLKVVLLWFGAWKNSMSCYAPEWFKRDTKRFPRAMTANGKPLEIATAFSPNVLQADKKAYSKLMEHLAETDSKENTVIMMQVENEIGMLEAARDHCPLAEAAWKKEHAKSDEEFQARAYARYVEQIAEAGKKIHHIPVYVNAALDSRNRKPGEYPSAGPLAKLINIWKAEAPSIDIYAPDIYDTGFKKWVAQYKRNDNPFFTPETRLSTNSGVRALYCFGEADALSFSPFAIDEGDKATTAPVTAAYKMIDDLKPILLKKELKRWGLLFSQQDSDLERIIRDGDNILKADHYYTLPWDPRAKNGTPWPEGGAIVIRLAADEYLISGSGVVVVFQTSSEAAQANAQEVRGEDGFIEQGKAGSKPATVQKKFQGQRLGIVSCDEVSVRKDGTLSYIRRLNGDQDHQGRHVRIPCGEFKTLHVKLYRY